MSDFFTQDEQNVMQFLHVLRMEEERKANPAGLNRTQPHNSLPPLQQLTSEQLPEQGYHNALHRLERAVVRLRGKTLRETQQQHLRHREAHWSNRIENINSEQDDRTLLGSLDRLSVQTTPALSPDALCHLVADWALPAQGIRKRVAGRRTRIMQGSRVIYTPPEGRQRLLKMLHDWQSFHSTSCWPGFVTAALSHIQYEAIHPLYDGNGRSGRAMLSEMIRREAGVPFTLPISKALFSKRNAYYDALNAPRLRHDYLGAVNFFLERFAEACNEASRLSAGN